MFDTATWKQVTGHFERLDKPAVNCTFIDGSRHYVVGLSDGALRVYSTEGGALVAAHTAHDKGVRGLAVSPDGRLLATAAYDGGVKVWDVGALTTPGSTSGGQGLFAVVDEAGGAWAVTATVDNYSATFAVTGVPDSPTPPRLERPRWLADLTLDRRDTVLPMRTFSWDVPSVGARLAHPTSPVTRAGKHWLVHSPSRMFTDTFHLLPELDPSLWSPENVCWTRSRDGTFQGLVRTRPEGSHGQLQRRVELLTHVVEPWGLRQLVESAIVVPLGWQVGACGFSPTQQSFLLSLGPYVVDLTLLPGSKVSAVGVEEDSQPKAEGDPDPSRSVRAFACSPNGIDLAAVYDDGLVHISTMSRVPCVPPPRHTSAAASTVPTSTGRPSLRSAPTAPCGCGRRRTSGCWLCSSPTTRSPHSTSTPCPAASSLSTTTAKSACSPWSTAEPPHVLVVSARNPSSARANRRSSVLVVPSANRPNRRGGSRALG